MLTHRTIRRTSLAALSCLAATVALGACGSSDDGNGNASTSSGTATGSSATGSGYFGGGSKAKSGTSTTAGSPTAAAGTLRLKADPGGALTFDRTTLTASAGTVTLDLLNPSTSGVPHAIAVEGNGVDQDGKTVDPGGTSTVAVTLKPGTYTFYCPVPGHEAAGMKGTLTVR
jgi:uncharacterized cupredoxin-like copper-binding protein